MDLETVLALCIVVGSLNLPFYAMCLDTWRTTVQIKEKCPHCVEGGETDG